MQTYHEADRVTPRSIIRYRPLSKGATGSRSLHWSIVIIITMLMTFILLWVFPLLWSKITVFVDDIEYGRPRTQHIEAFVGHEADAKTPSHFVATNISGQAYVFELPAGQSSQMRVFSGPRLTGPDAELAPVLIRFETLPGHKYPDMIISMQGYETRYLNQNGTFVPEGS